MAVVIDNGSHALRIGDNDDCCHVFRNAMFKFRDGTSRVGRFGENFGGTESTPFERNVVTNFECQQRILSSAMKETNISLEDRPCVFTIPPLIPSASIGSLTEMLMETYRSNRLSYGVDSVHSFNYNVNNNNTAAPCVMIIDMGYNAIHLMSIFRDNENENIVLRVPFGSRHVDSYLQRRLLLKTSHLKSTLTRQYVEQKREEICFVAKHVRERLRNIQQSDWGKTTNENEMDRHVVVQLPTTSSTSSSSDKKIRRISQIKSEKKVRDAENLSEELDRLLELKRSIDVLDPEVCRGMSE